MKFRLVEDAASEGRAGISASVWDDLLPSHVARDQKAWESRRLVRRMSAVGMSTREIAERLGITTHRVLYLHCNNPWKGVSPVVRYCNEPLKPEVAILLMRESDQCPAENGR